MRPVILAFIAIAGFAVAFRPHTNTIYPGSPGNNTYYTLAAYPAVEKYDAHVHVFTNDPYFVRHSLEDNFRLLSINVGAPDLPPIRAQQAYAVHQLKNFPGQFAYASTFDVNNWNDADWKDKTIAYLSGSFKEGAIAVKVWKNIGMELKDQKGKFVLIDNVRFDSIFDFIESNGKTLIGHIGEPRNCWLPLKDMTVKNDRDYFSTHPQYHMYLHPEYPSYEQQIDARDRMLTKHRHLKFVGAHLGSLEWSVDELARRLDSFPEMAVDLAERVSHMEYQTVRNHQKVYDFFIKYQDRIIYGTDTRVDDTMDSATVIQHVHRTRVEDWKFFVTDEIMEAPEVSSKFQALHLPREVVDKIYRKNAEKWFPGLTLRPAPSTAPAPAPAAAFAPAPADNPAPASSLLVKKTPDFEISGDGANANWGKTDWVNIAQRDTADKRSTAERPYETKAKALYSSTGMYFLFHCEDKKLTSALQADFSDLWNEDVIEVFIQPDSRRTAYFEYELSPLNYELPITVYNEKGKLNSWLPFHYQGDRKTRHATIIRGGEKTPYAAVDGWTAEFFVPYKILKPLIDSLPVSGTRWKGNLYRIDYDKGQSFSSWRLTRTNFHDYERFGVFAFE